MFFAAREARAASGCMVWGAEYVAIAKFQADLLLWGGGDIFRHTFTENPTL